MRGEKFTGSPCVKCKSTLRYVNVGDCVNCVAIRNEAQSLKRSSRLSRSRRLITKTKVKTIYFDGKIADEFDLNPYEYNAEIGKFCAWQAGFNDSRATVNL